MADNVNENYVEKIFDEGTKKPQQGEKKQKVEFDAKNYLNTRLDDNETSREIRVRIVLTKDIDGRDKVAIPIETHSIMLNEKQQKAHTIATGKFKSFICPDDPHIRQDGDNPENTSKCPLCEKKKELFADAEKTCKKGTAEWKAKCKEAYKFDSKTTYITRLIERGAEADGIKFWRYNKHDDGSGIFDKLLNIAKLYQRSGIKVYDYETGYDLIITIKKSDKSDKMSIDVCADVLPSKLAPTKEEIDAIVNDPKDWRDMYRTKSYDYLKLVADGESPIWSTEENKYVAWVDPEELKKRDKDAEQDAAKELKVKVQEVSDNNEEEDLPF